MLEEHEAEVVGEIKLPPFRSGYAHQSTSQMGAVRMLHVTCPCCGLIYGVDHDDAASAMAARVEANFQQYSRNRFQQYSTNAWGWKANYRGDTSDNKTGRRHMVRSDTIDCVQTGVGKLLRKIWKQREKRAPNRPWFAVLWHDVPHMTRNFFACEVASLFSVLRAIADDSPTFAQRLIDVGRAAFKRDGSRSSASTGVDRQSSP